MEKARLEQDLREAMRAGDTLRTSTIRLALAAMKNLEIERRRPLTEEEVEDVLSREVKRRREAIEGFQQGGREDLAERESLEMAILLGYLPKPLSEDAIRGIVGEVINEIGAQSAADVGRVMSVVMPKVRGRADGSEVNRLVRQALGA